MLLHQLDSWQPLELQQTAVTAPGLSVAAAAQNREPSETRRKSLPPFTEPFPLGLQQFTCALFLKIRLGPQRDKISRLPVTLSSGKL